MRRARSLLRRADGWVFAPGDARQLAAVRIGLCGLLAVRLAMVDYGAVTGPGVPFRPVFYMRLFDRMPSHEVAIGLQTCGIVAAIVAAAGLVLRVSLPGALVCSLVLDGMLNSSGRVIVGDAVLILCLVVLVACGSAAGDAWSMRGPVRRLLRREPPGGAPSTGARYGWPVRTAMVAVTLAYFFAGFQKWRYSGLDWVTSDNLRLILYASSDHQPHPNGLALFVADRPLLAHLLAAGSLALETCFPLVLFVPRLRWLFIPGVVAMHLGIWLALRLDYSAQALTAVIVFVNWPVVVTGLSRAASAPLWREAPG